MEKPNNPLDAPVVAEPTTKELREELTALGMPVEDTEKLTTKAQIKAVINTLKAKNVIVDVAPNPKEEADTEKKWRSKADKMKAHLDAQPKVRVLIPLEGQEKPGVVKQMMVNGREETVVVSGSVWSKTFNGYKVTIPKGIYTEVAEQIADNISDEFSQTTHAGDQWLLDRIDPATGRPVRDRLT